MFNRLKLLLAGFLLSASAPVASADVLDFGSYANASDITVPGSPADNEQAFTFGSTITPTAAFNPLGFTVTLYSWTNTPIPASGSLPTGVDAGQFTKGTASFGDPASSAPPSTYAYLDSSFQGRNGGLGVTKEITDNFQANPSSDDNVSAATDGGEVLGFSLDQSTILTAVTFRDAEHFSSFGNGDTLDYTLDGGSTWLTHDLGSSATLSLANVKYSANTILGFAYNNAQFYVDTVVTIPEPGSLLTFAALNGMMGVCIRRRRRPA